MRRMYSEKELTEIIQEVFDQEIASGAFDEKVSDAVDAYLVAHPVDVTALEGQDVELASLDATGLITGGEIVEKMSGYNFVPQSDTACTKEFIYCGICKNGNKLTAVVALNITPLETLGAYLYFGQWTIPATIVAKLSPSSVSGIDVLDARKCQCFDSEGNLYEPVEQFVFARKEINGFYMQAYLPDLVVGKTYYIRYEVTFLLSENLAPEE